MATEVPKSRTTIEIPVDREGRKRPARVHSLTRSTGPRTLRGKQKSRYNSLKHGIFGVALLADESRSEYENLLQGLNDHLKPAGQFEELLVEKLAVLFWRYRRLLQAESAEVESGLHQVQERMVEFPKPEGPYSREEVGVVPCALFNNNEGDQFSALLGLGELQDRLARRGLDLERDRPLLRSLWGKRFDFEAEQSADLDRTLPSQEGVDEEAQGFNMATEGGADQDKHEPEERIGREAVAQAGLPEAGQPGAHSQRDILEQYFVTLAAGEKGARAKAKEVKQLLQLIDEDVRFFSGKVVQAVIARSRRAELDGGRAKVPPLEAVERLQRYEASLERAIDRTLSQLERLQRLRAGLPVPPPLKVDVARD